MFVHILYIYIYFLKNRIASGLYYLFVHMAKSNVSESLNVGIDKNDLKRGKEI